MSENIQSVDVEKIMEEIRANINAREETDEVLSFDESSADMEYGNEIVGSVVYTDKELHHYVVNANQEHNIPFYQMIPKGGLKSFVKRFIRRTVAFIILPLRDAQNRYNANVVHALMQIEAYSLDQREEMQAYIEEQEKRAGMQEEDIEKLAERLQILEKKYEALLNEKSREGSL